MSALEPAWPHTGQEGAEIVLYIADQPVSRFEGGLTRQVSTCSSPPP